ncbi:MAG: diaminopimelate epimerase [Actinomycetota bacterium]|nr:diaminopimelate epimerase [Actinomycetota bacterium]
MDFVKAEGLGNDFIVVTEPLTISSERIAELCRRKTGVGADGILEITALDPTSVAMRYWNADGGAAEMCGNGLRCVALIAVEYGIVEGPALTVQSAVGDHPATVLDGGIVRAFVGVPHAFRTEELIVAGHTVRPVGVGNPHAVLFVDDVDETDVDEIGPVIERDAIFPDGSNVEFVEFAEGDRIKVRVWERGVGETQASGTGSAAAAFAARAVHELRDAVTVALAGGELLIEFDEDGAWMTGPAAIVYRGTVD